MSTKREKLLTSRRIINRSVYTHCRKERRDDRKRRQIEEEEEEEK
jgi:hypothetical protein